jgi:hypothetical protein
MKTLFVCIDETLDNPMNVGGSICAPRPFVVAWVRAVAEARPRYRPRNCADCGARREREGPQWVDLSVPHAVRQLSYPFECPLSIDADGLEDRLRQLFRKVVYEDADRWRKALALGDESCESGIARKPGGRQPPARLPIERRVLTTRDAGHPRRALRTGRSHGRSFTPRAHAGGGASADGAAPALRGSARDRARAGCPSPVRAGR